jgi:hypothetical protein
MVLVSTAHKPTIDLPASNKVSSNT